MKVKKKNRTLKQSYRLENPQCEIHEHLEGELWDSIRIDLGNRRVEDWQPEIHHIWGGHAHRWDIVPNLIALSKPAHAYCHLMPQHGRIVCLWVKLWKGELDRELWRECMGFDPIGILDHFDAKEEWVENMLIDIYERVSSYE